MYLTTSQEIWMQHREEISHGVATARLMKRTRANGEAMSRLVGNLRWELARYAGLFGKRLHR